MGKKQSKIDLLYAGICPDCGGKLHFKNLIEKKRLEAEGYKPIGHGVFQKNHVPHDEAKKSDQKNRNNTEAEKTHRVKAKWRARNLKLAESKRSRRNLKRLEMFKREGLKR